MIEDRTHKDQNGREFSRREFVDGITVADLDQVENRADGTFAAPIVFSPARKDGELAENVGERVHVHGGERTVVAFEDASPKEKPKRAVLVYRTE